MGDVCNVVCGDRELSSGVQTIQMLQSGEQCHDVQVLSTASFGMLFWKQGTNGSLTTGITANEAAVSQATSCVKQCECNDAFAEWPRRPRRKTSVCRCKFTRTGAGRANVCIKNSPNRCAGITPPTTFQILVR